MNISLKGEKGFITKAKTRELVCTTLCCALYHIIPWENCSCQHYVINLILKLWRWTQNMKIFHSRCSITRGAIIWPQKSDWWARMLVIWPLSGERKKAATMILSESSHRPPKDSWEHLTRTEALTKIWEQQTQTSFPWQGCPSQDSLCMNVCHIHR